MQIHSQQRNRKPVVAIVGVGLIGGSLGMAWKLKGVVEQVIGVARREATVDEALRVGAIDRGTMSVHEGVKDADVVVIATPVHTIVPTYESMKDVLQPTAIVTDVGSTKARICRSIWNRDGARANAGPFFIGGHPMAGSERDGVLNADPYLFENAVYVLTPPSDAPPSAVEGLTDLVRATGANTLVMPPERHDEIVATVSHLPHMVATSLVNLAAERDDQRPGTLALAAGGFRDTTRIASGPENVWTDIALSNAEPLINDIDRLIDELTAIQRALKTRDAAAIRRKLADARQVRAAIPAKAKGIMSPVFDVVVQVVDRPGSIRDVATLLGDAGVNIIDIEILRVREGEGGTLRLGFERREEMERALQTLSFGGYRAVYRG